MSFGKQRALRIERYSANHRFRERLLADGGSWNATTVAAGFDAICDFYAAERADECDPEAGGDTLAVRWATSEWYLFTRAERTDLRLFGVVLDREMVSSADDDIPLALSFVLLFEPSADLVALGCGEFSCGIPDQLANFRRVVHASRVFAAVGLRPPTAVRMIIGWVDRAEQNVVGDRAPQSQQDGSGHFGPST